VLPQRIGNWSLTSLQQRLMKTGGRLVKHARYYWLLWAESHLTRRLFASMVRRIELLPVPTGLTSQQQGDYRDQGCCWEKCRTDRSKEGRFHASGLSGSWKLNRRRSPLGLGELHTRLTVAFGGGEVYVN
jgi:hypothetical protein